MLIHGVPALPVWGATLREMDAARRGMQRLLDAMTGLSEPRAPGVFPAVNVTERPEALYVRAELPGIEPDRIDITVENNTLTLSGERRPAVDEHASYHRREREWGTFRRSLTLPVRIDAKGVRATHRDGVLTVELPKAAEARPRQIDVHVGD